MVDTATEDTAAMAAMAAMEDTVMAMEVMVMALDTMAVTAAMDMAATATDMVADTDTATITTVIVAAPTLTLIPLMITARLHPPALLLRLHELTNSDRTRVLNHTTIAENRSVRPIK